MDAVHPELAAGADRVAVELTGGGGRRADDDGGAGHPVHQLVGVLALEQHPPGQGDPGEEVPRVQDHDVELPVVDRGVRQQRHARLEEADVADHDGAGAVPGELAAVDRHLDPDGGEHQRLQRREDVGEPADPLLDVLVDALHDRGVEAHAGHHHEVGVLDVVAADLDQVDRPVLAVQRHVDRGPDVERDVEVAGQQVAGAGRHDPDRDAGAGELRTHLADGAVPAADEDQVGARHRGRLGHAGARVLDRRVVPRRGRPAGLLRHRGHDRPELTDVLHLDRVEDHGQLALGLEHLRQRLGALGVTAWKRVVDSDPQQHEERPEQYAADHVAGVVPAEVHPVEADQHDDEYGDHVDQPPHTGAAYQHRDQDHDDAGERGRRRGVPGRVRVRGQDVDLGLPRRPVAADQQLDAGRRERGADHHASGEERRPPVALHEHEDRQDRGHDGHADRVERQLDPTQRAVHPLRVDRPRLRAAATVVEVADHRPPLVDGQAQQEEQAEADGGPREQGHTRTVEHSAPFGSAPGRATHSMPPPSMLTASRMRAASYPDEWHPTPPLACYAPPAGAWTALSSVVVAPPRLPRPPCQALRGATLATALGSAGCHSLAT